MSRFARRIMRARQSGGAPPSSFTHGDQVTSSNVGYVAYFDTGLGRTLQLSDLQTISGDHWISDYMNPGDTIYKKHFTGLITIDINNVNFVGCLFDVPVRGDLNGTHASGWTLTNCTVDPPTPADETLYFDGYTATRCLLQGCSDGVKANGASTSLIECYIRTKAQDTQDHNDGIQNVGGSGPVNVIRCNIDAKPVNADVYGLAAGNAALFFADGETGLHTVHDNLLASGGYTLCMYDTGTFDVQGNKFVRGSYLFDTHSMAGPGSGPQNVTWGTLRANTFSDNGEVIPL